MNFNQYIGKVLTGADLNTLLNGIILIKFINDNEMFHEKGKNIKNVVFILQL
jgi:hypothetical protein